MSFEPKNILVPVALEPDEDFSLAEHSLMAACDLALKFNSKVTLLHLAQTMIVGGGPGLDMSGKLYDSIMQVLEERLANRRHKLEELQRLAKIKGLSVEGRVVDSLESIPDIIIETADELNIDLIVMGSHGRRGLSKILFGSVAEKVVKKVNRPILLLHPFEEKHE